MKRFIFPTILFIVVITALPNCATKPKRSRKPVTSININSNHKNYTSGTDLIVSTVTKLKNGNLDNVKILLDDKLITESENLENEVKIETKDLGMGFHTLKAVVLKKDGVRGENYKKFEIVSDIMPKKYGVKVKNIYPHSTKFFTQGFEFHNGFIYEGTGERGVSGIFKTDLNTGKVLQEKRMDDKYFGEGITILNNKIYQLTYTSQTGFIYDLNTLETVDSWKYKQKEGWGLTNDGKSLIMSDGSEIIRFLDPESLNEIKKIHVYNHLGPVKYINEMEYIKGEIWANVWTTNSIVRIDPFSGKVLGEIDMQGLDIMLNSEKERIDVLNGIAWNEEEDKIYVTGKLWPKIFEVEILSDSN